MLSQNNFFYRYGPYKFIPVKENPSSLKVKVVERRDLEDHASEQCNKAKFYPMISPPDFPNVSVWWKE